MRKKLFLGVNGDPNLNKTLVRKMLRQAKKMHARYETVSECIGENLPEFCDKDGKTSRHRITQIHNIVSEAGLVPYRKTPFNHSHYYFDIDDNETRQAVIALLRGSYNPKNKRFTPRCRDSWRSFFIRIGKEEIDDFEPLKYHQLMQRLSYKPEVQACVTSNGSGKGRKMHVAKPNMLEQVLRNLIREEKRKKYPLVEVIAEELMFMYGNDEEKAKKQAHHLKPGIIDDERLSRHICIYGEGRGKFYWIRSWDGVSAVRMAARQMLRRTRISKRVNGHAAPDSYEPKNKLEKQILEKLVKSGRKVMESSRKIERSSLVELQ